MPEQRVETRCGTGIGEGWTEVVIGPQLDAPIGHKDLEKALGSETAGDATLAALLDDESALRLSDIMSRGTGACKLSGRSGMTIEALLTSSGEGERYRLFFRPLRFNYEREVFYRHFITSPIAICYTDANGSILNANSSFLSLYGYTFAEVKGKNPRMLKSGRQSPDVYKKLWKDISNPEIGHWTGEIINRKRDGSEVTVLLSIAAVSSAKEGSVGYVASTLDISRLKRLEAELRVQNQDLGQLVNLKNDLMAIASHDLKAPLAAMINYATLVKEEYERLGAEKILSYMDKISSTGHRLTNFISDMLDMRKIESGAFELALGRVHLDNVLKSVVEVNNAAGASQEVSVVLDTPARIAPIMADAVKLDQVFNNLVSNAVKFSPPGGTVEVSLREEDGLVVEVGDQGPGIPEQDIGSIFDQYFQVKRKGGVAQRVHGAGLGLSIVGHIVEQHGGSVKAMNKEGGGCLFKVILPRRHMDTQNMAVLIVDTSATLFDALQKPLSRKGMALFIAGTMKEAKRIIDFEYPEIVFMNCINGVSGLENTVSALGLDGSASRVVAICKAREQKRISGVFRVISTPVMDMEIFEIIESVADLNGSAQTSGDAPK